MLICIQMVGAGIVVHQNKPIIHAWHSLIGGFSILIRMVFLVLGHITS